MQGEVDLHDRGGKRKNLRALIIARRFDPFFAGGTSSTRAKNLTPWAASSVARNSANSLPPGLDVPASDKNHGSTTKSSRAELWGAEAAALVGELISIEVTHALRPESHDARRVATSHGCAWYVTAPLCELSHSHVVTLVKNLGRVIPPH